MESKVFNSDCLEGMKQYPDKWFDLAVVDPPYGIGEDGARANALRKTKKCKNPAGAISNYIIKNWDKEPPNKLFFKELIRVSKNQVVFGANHFISNIPFDSSCWIVWDKKNGESHFADCELAWTSFDSAVRKISLLWNGFQKCELGKRIHPTQKPVKLYDWIYKNYLPNGGRVIDTHGGSMSNLIAGIKAGNIEMTVFEIDTDYYNEAKVRVENFQAQGNLFGTSHNIIWH